MGRSEGLCAGMLGRKGDVICGMEVAAGDFESERRREELVDAACNLSTAGDCERTRWRTKVVLNVHHDERCIFNATNFIAKPVHREQSVVMRLWGRTGESR